MKCKTACVVLAAAAMMAGYAWADEPKDEPGFVSLFDGKSLDGWKVGKNPECFQVRDGMIVVNGQVAHLFYDGEVGNHSFKNFVLRVDVMTFSKANSGIYFHTKFQDEGFPKFGIESQVNNSHGDPIRSGSLWGIKNVYKVPVKDEVWYTQEITVQGKQVVVKLDGKEILRYTLPKDPDREFKTPTGNTWLPRGTFALQGHDPGSKVYFKNIRVKILPD